MQTNGRRLKKTTQFRFKFIFVFVLWFLCFFLGFKSVTLECAGFGSEGALSISVGEVFSKKDGVLTGKTIVVDAGHGGSDPGTIAPNTKVQEADLNLEIAYVLENELKKLGANVVMTRTEESTKELGEERKLTADERKEMIENADADLLLSIHQNFNEDSSAIKGTQILVRDSQSVPFAESLQKAFNKELDADLHYIQDQYWILSFGEQPSVVVECGFFSNKQDERQLQTEEYQRRLVRILVDEIQNYWGINPN